MFSVQGEQDFRTYTEIDLQTIQQNAAAIKRWTGTKLIAVVKADAYGHGAARVAEALHPIAEMLAVATVEEGIALRKIGIRSDILVLFSCLPTQVGSIAEFNLIPALADSEFATALNALAATTQVHVNVNTGMNRNGVHYTEASAFLNRLESLQHLDIRGVFTHLATADATDKRFVRTQLARFSAVRANDRGALVHAANSAATLAVPESHFHAVRPGLSLYGIYPAAERPIPLKPALTWKTRIGWIGTLSEGDGVSYGLTYKTRHPTRVAMLQVGYADGYPRSLSNSGEVLIGGNRRPIIGQVCMDVSVARLEPTDRVAVGDEVVLIGRQGTAEITADAVAERAGTIAYEILTQIGPRVARTFLPKPERKNRKC